MRWIAGVAAVALAACASLGGGAQLTVEGGAIAGASEGGVRVWRNIPYAAAPVGDRRWAAPQPVTAWEGVRDATRNGPSCPQPMLESGKANSGGAYGPVSEDCLQLNVYAPASATKAPVMVWIHGGSHRTGAGWVYDGTAFARDGIVVVTINYRLGALGYLSHPGLGQHSGNYGLMDQVAALNWVKRNIAQFGGDPGNVTLFGESAGGWSTMAVLATPSANGLYHRAIVESGGGWYPPQTQAEKDAAGAKLLAAIGVSETATAAELRAIPMEKLAQLSGDYSPFADGTLMPETPSQALARGHLPDVPLIIGWNSGEDTLMGPSPLPEATLKQIPAIARMVYKEEAAKGDEALARVIFTDSVFGAPARWVANKASGGAPSWLYHFSYVGEQYRATRTSAGHATEIPYVWKMWTSPVGDVGEADKPMAELMHACWAAFAKTGAPCAQWPAYTPSTDQLMEFSADSGVRTGFKKGPFTAQETVGLPGLKLGE
jgi:para-nitrobenzyl esterase